VHARVAEVGPVGGGGAVVLAEDPLEDVDAQAAGLVARVVPDVVVAMIVIVVAALVRVGGPVGVVVEASDGDPLQTGSGDVGGSGTRSSEVTSNSLPAATSTSVDPHGHRNTGTSSVVRAPHRPQAITAGMWSMSSTEP